MKSLKDTNKVEQHITDEASKEQRRDFNILAEKAFALDPHLSRFKLEELHQTLQQDLLETLGEADDITVSFNTDKLGEYFEQTTQESFHQTRGVYSQGEITVKGSAPISFTLQTEFEKVVQRTHSRPQVFHRAELKTSKDNAESLNAGMNDIERKPENSAAIQKLVQKFSS